jgi:hypothetical protein
MILTGSSKLCVTLILVLALLAVMNMDSTSKPVANTGSVNNSSSSSVKNSKSSSVESMSPKKSSRPTFKTNTSSKTVTSMKTKSSKPAAKTRTAVKKVAKISKAKKVSAPKKGKKETKFKASDYLPKDVNKKWWNTDFSVAKNKVNNKNLIPTQNYVTGINTVASSLRLANHDLRARPANPQIVVSPWLNTTVAPDHNTKPLGI